MIRLVGILHQSLNIFSISNSKNDMKNKSIEKMLVQHRICEKISIVDGKSLENIGRRMLFNFT